MGDKARAGVRGLLDQDEVSEVLRERFYRPDDDDPPPRRRRARRAQKPDHYKVICISLYREDLDRLDEKVRAAKAAGHTKMSRSALIRYALDQVDVEDLPKGY
ncbi:MAG: hypothetical protein ACFCGT_09385 [Sandaracinaceae bacterium]